MTAKAYNLWAFLSQQKTGIIQSVAALLQSATTLANNFSPYVAERSDVPFRRILNQLEHFHAQNGVAIEAHKKDTVRVYALHALTQFT